MKLVAGLGLVAMLGACAPEQTPQQKAAADAAAVAEVEANQAPPPEVLKPEPILYPDIEKYGLFGAGCNFAPKGSMGAVVLAQAERGYLKRSGEVLTFAADKGSAQNPLNSWRKYDGKDYSFTLELGSQDGDPSGYETVDFPATLTVKDGKGQVVHSAAGIAQCGS